MAAIIYLDVDDEITSAAARIRTTEERRVVLVVPGGSRLATSRINFRLIAREAQTRGRRLWIVAGDGATRALAASAGLAVYASVLEYEDAMEAPAPPSPSGQTAGADHPAATDTAAPSPRRKRRAPATDDGEDGQPGTGAAGVGAAGIGAAGTGAAGVADAADLAGTAGAIGGEFGATMAEPAATAEAEIAAIGSAAAPSGATPAGLTAPAAPTPAARTPVVEPTAPPTPYAPPPRPARRPERSEAGSSIPIVRPRREWPIGRTTAIIAALGLAMIVAVGGVAAYVFLPSATIVVTAHPVAIGPIDLTVRADPAATAINPETDTVPAQELTFKIDVSDTFETKGTRVEKTRATGSVTFENGTTSAKTIAAGSIVSTEGGIQFRTARQVTIPPSEIFPIPSIGKASVGIDAVVPGTEGNVPANAITVVPRGEDPNELRVNNPDPTAGGTRKEFPRVEQDEIDAAIANLRKKLATRFNQLLANPSGVPEGMTLFPETQALGKGTTTTDPGDLVDKEVDSFDLGMTANGTVTAVDETAVEEFAASEITADVAEGHRLLDGSVDVSIGDPTVDGDVVTFPAKATAQQVRELDAKAMLAEVRGKTVPQARSILAQYGEVDVSVWPEWVTAIPTIDARVSLRAETSTSPLEPGESGAPGESSGPDASASP
jgi:hypothetical protein